MIKYMLDANICIYVIKHRPPVVRDKFNQHAHEIAISSVVASELYYGAFKSGVPRHMEELERFMLKMKVWPFDDFAAVSTGKVRASLAGKGRPIGPYDSMIAGHALSNNQILVTNNVREFERVEGLKLENWVTDDH